MNKRSLSEQLLQATLELQRKNRAIGALHGTDLSLYDSHLLTELSANPTLDSNSLAALLALNQSSVSRIVKRLKNRQYLSIKKSNEDSRCIEFTLTTKAQSAINQIDLRANEILEKFSKNISTSELHQLKAAIQKFCDGFDLPRAPAREGEHLIRVEQRRLARCLRILGTKNEDTLLSASEQHVLRLLREFPRGLSPKQIAQRLNLQGSALSVLLKNFRLLKYITSTTHAADARREIVQLTETGSTVLKQHEAQIVLRVEAAIRDFKVAELQEFARIFKEFLKDEEYGPGAFKKRFSVKKLKTPAERQVARLHVLEQLIRESNLDAAPEFLFAADSQCFAMMEGDHMRIAIELRNQEEVNFFSNLKQDEINFEKHFRAALKIK